MASVIAFSEAFLDIDCRFDQYAEIRLGGACANLAANIVQLGGKSAIISRVIDDYIGQRFLSEIRKYKIDTNGIFLSKNQTSRNIINFIYKNKEKKDFLTYDMVGSDHIDISDININVINNYDIFHFGSKAISSMDTLLFCITESKKLGKKISYDVNYRNNIWRDKNTAIKNIRNLVNMSDFVKMNLYEAMLFSDAKNNFDKTFEFIIEQSNDKVFFITDGENGSYVIYQKNIKKIDSINVDALDELGAGDAFFSVILFSINLQEITMEHLIDITIKANTIASLSTKYIGTINAFKFALDESPPKI